MCESSLRSDRRPRGEGKGSADAGRAIRERPSKDVGHTAARCEEKVYRDSRTRSTDAERESNASRRTNMCLGVLGAMCGGIRNLENWERKSQPPSNQCWRSSKMRSAGFWTNPNGVGAFLTRRSCQRFWTLWRRSSGRATSSVRACRGGARGWSQPVSSSRRTQR